MPSVGKTLRHEAWHLLAAVALGVVVWWVSQNTVSGLIAAAVCFFLDADHGVDYLGYLIKFRRRFVLAEFLSGSYFAEWQKFITPLHSWELVIGLVAAGMIGHWTWPVGAAVGLAVHYLIDYLTNPVNGWAYWLSYRAKHGWYKPAIARGFRGR